MHNDRHWILTVPPQRELKAAQALRDLGYDAWTPVEYRYRRVNRHSGRKVAAPYVILNRYVVIAAPDLPWTALSGLRERGLVHGYLGINGAPAALPHAEAARLRTIGDHVKPTAVRVNRGIRCGDTCMIVFGPHAGTMVKVERIKKGEARVLLEWLGATREVQLPLDRLEAA